MENILGITKVQSRKSLYLFFVVVLLAVSGYSCKDDCPTCDTCEECPIENEYTEIDSWILDNMETYYLWNEQMPGSTDKSLHPEEYFNSLLSNEDRFSWIQDNYVELMNSLSGVNTEAGYDFNLFALSDATDPEVAGYITYIKPGAPAESVDLKRGDFFLKINGTQMKKSNLTSLLGQIAQPHTLGKAVVSGNVISEGNTITLQVVEYAENPILLDTIYTIEKKKIGYFVYNFFARDNGDESITYEKELNNLFGEFKSEGINELIIDLRYNGGGAVSTSIALASMISNCTPSQIFGFEKYNKILDNYYQKRYGQDYNKTYFIETLERYDGDEVVVETVPINQLGLSRLHLIVSDRTASASELIINALKPYMEVVLIGTKTVGKNVGSYTIYETDPVKQQSNAWGMQPIVLKFENSLGFSDYGNGFVPDKKVDEFDEYSSMKPLGEVEELVLSTALDQVLGRTPVRRNKVSPSYRRIGSSVDRMPARQNMYVELPPFHK